MNAEKLLKTLPVLQAQLDALLEFDCQSNDLTNGICMPRYLCFNVYIYMYSFRRRHQYELHAAVP